MAEPGLDDLDQSDRSSAPPARFFDAPFLRKVLNDLTLALDLGRPVFLIGPAGCGKTTLADQAAVLLGARYGVVRVAGARGLTFDDLVAACTAGFAPDAWTDLAMPRPRAVARPGDSVVIVDVADAIPPRFIEQMVALSNGSPDLLPSHRVLFMGGEDLADVLDGGRVRNNWGTPLVLHLQPWPCDAVAPFLRRRLRSAGFGDPDLLSDAAIGTIAAGADGNPGRMLDLARRILQPADVPAGGWIELPTAAASRPAARPVSIIELEAVATTMAEPAGLLFAELPAAPNLDRRARPHRAQRGVSIEPRRLMQLALPVGLVVAAGCIVWVVDDPAPPPPIVPPSQQIIAAATPAPVPVAVAVPVPVPAPEPVVAVAASAPVADPAPAVPIGTLMARGDALLSGGDFAAARMFYLQAVRAGSAQAATGVARTYDPRALGRLGVVGARGEPAKAAEWYRKAVDLGDPTAAEPLKRLTP